MLLWIVSFYEFRQFLQIVWWIALPVTVIAIIVTVVMHYRRKKHAGVGEPEQRYLFATAGTGESGPVPDWLASSNPDNSSLLKKYEREIRRYKEDYAKLEQDFHQLEEKYSSLMNKAYHADKQGDDKLVKLLQEQVQEYKQKVDQLQQQRLVMLAADDSEEYQLPALQATIEQLQDALHVQEMQKEETIQEVSRLENMLRNMERSIETSREENSLLHKNFAQQLEETGRVHQSEKDVLHEQLQQAQQAFEKIQAGEEIQYDPRIQELQLLLQQTTDEKLALQQQLAEQPFVQDMVQEGKLQINFLQNQLEQRIKSYHFLEHQADEAAAQMEQLRTAIRRFEQQVQEMKDTLHQRQQEITDTQAALERSREDGHQQQEALRNKVEHIEKLEINLQELQEHQEVLQSVIGDKEDAIRQLQENVAHEQQKAKEMENKLELSSQLLVRIYTELAQSLNTGLVTTVPEALQLQEPGAVN